MRLLFGAGWLFFGVWSAVLLALNFAAFRAELFPSRDVSESRVEDPAPQTSGNREPWFR
jgi:hypothetical protein